MTRRELLASAAAPAVAPVKSLSTKPCGPDPEGILYISPVVYPLPSGRLRRRSDIYYDPVPALYWKDATYDGEWYARQMLIASGFEYLDQRCPRQMNVVFNRLNGHPPWTLDDCEKYIRMLLPYNAEVTFR